MKATYFSLLKWALIIGWLCGMPGIGYAITPAPDEEDPFRSSVDDNSGDPDFCLERNSNGTVEGEIEVGVHTPSYQMGPNAYQFLIKCRFFDASNPGQALPVTTGGTEIKVILEEGEVIEQFISIAFIDGDCQAQGYLIEIRLIGIDDVTGLDTEFEKFTHAINLCEDAEPCDEEYSGSNPVVTPANPNRGAAAFSQAELLASSLAMYPNPTQGQAILSFELAEATPIGIEVVDMQGRSIAYLRQETFLPSGPHQFKWDLTALPAGMYYVRIQVGLLRQRLALVKSR